MINKTYLFTEKEVILLRDACIEYYQFLKSNPNKSPAALAIIESVKALKDQFKDDIK